MSRLVVPAWWCVPAECGDFRLEALDAGRSVLTVIDPTEADRARLTPFFRAVNHLDAGWMVRAYTSFRHALSGAARPVLSDAPNRFPFAPTGETRIVIERPIGVLGPLLSKDTEEWTRVSQVWTVLRHEGGVFFAEGPNLPQVEVPDEPPEPISEAGSEPAPPKLEVVTTLDPEGKPKRKEKPKAEKPTEAPVAATVKVPKVGCPPPAAASRRASEVLRAFCTATQWRDYERHGKMRVVGGMSGRTYIVHHRDVAHRLGLSRCVTVANTGRPVCLWDDRVPPEEETLGLKLLLEHREQRLHEDPLQLR